MDKFAEKVEKLEVEALEPLLEWARAVVPRGRWTSTPLFLLGTAGLRKLTESDREKVLTESRRILSRSGFRFEAPWAKILDGSDEGIFAWVALNAAAGTLGGEHTVGALDLGGSSLQVTFAMDSGGGSSSSRTTKKGGDDDDDDEGKGVNDGALSISIAGAEHSLYTHSHYHFGLDDAFERSVTMLIERAQHTQTTTGRSSEKGKKAEKKKSRSLLFDDDDGGDDASEIVVDHPCLHKGYREQYIRIPLENKIPPTPATVTLVGKSNSAACTKLAVEVVAAKTECDAPPCTLGVPQPRSAGKFTALAGFYVVSHFFNLSPAAGGLAGLRSAGDAFCPLPWEEVQARHPGELSVEAYCFRAAYVASLVSQGLQLKDDQVEIGEGSAGWTLGAALVEGYREAGLGGSTSSSTSSGGSTLVPFLSASSAQVAAWVLGGLALGALIVAIKRGNVFFQWALRRRGWIQARRRSSSNDDLVSVNASEFGEDGVGSMSSGVASLQQQQQSSSHDDYFSKNIFYKIFGYSSSSSSSSQSSSLLSSHASAVFSAAKGRKSISGSILNVNGVGYDGNGTDGRSGGGIASENNNNTAAGVTVGRSLSRSATYIRRLSALESGCAGSSSQFTS